MSRPAGKCFLVTGGAGFIGSALVRHLIQRTPHTAVVFDKLTYSGNLSSLAPVAGSPRFRFAHGDICDGAALAALFDAVKPHGVIHLAAETHVDRSIDGAEAFVQTNVVGTQVLLDAALAYWRTLQGTARDAFRFHHVSTDEVFGSLGESGVFDENSPYRPNSPYAASKAAADHFVRAWHRTYGLPVVTSNSGNNYGPYQFPEKLIPLTILNCIAGKTLPVYGDGTQMRDWLHVDDHVRALLAIAEHGRAGETYGVGGGEQLANIDVVRAIVAAVDRQVPVAKPREALIRFVADRPGHDFRYAVDTTKIRSELGWRPTHTFASGLEQSVAWYLANRGWWTKLRARYGGERLGLAG